LASQKESFLNIIELISKKLIDAEKLLTELDSPAGDADCGTGVKRGFEAVLKAMDEMQTMELGDMLKKVGFTLAYTIGGTSGAMLGTGFIELGKAIGDENDPDISKWASALNTSLEVIKRRGGGTVVGDKTLVDALEPAVLSVMESAKDPGVGASQVFETAYEKAKKGSDSTVELIARKGRASYLGERSKGHRDPGSVVIYLMFEAVVEYLRA
jgi:dihydroxyacetone kinase-like protein